ncbi:tetratricopeptide repeat protein [Embleya sp. NPDC055664]
MLTRRLGRLVTPSDAGLVEPGVVPGPRDTVDALVEIGSLDMDPTRRAVVVAAVFSTALTVPGWAEASARADTIRTADNPRYGAPDVRTVRAMAEAFSDMDDEHGGGAARPPAAAYLVNTVLPYLRASAPDAVRRDMLSAAADLTYLLGWMAMDERADGLAQSYYVHAMHLAREAGDEITYATALRGLSVQAVQLKHGVQSLHLADAAASAATALGAPRMRAFLTGQQAHALAEVKDRRAAFNHLGQAERALDQATSGPEAFGSYHHAALAFYTSHVLAALGDTSGAIDAMVEANRIRPARERRSRARSTAQLAELQVDDGRLDEACASWDAFLDDYPYVHSGRLNAHHATMRARLAPHTGNARARALLTCAASH